MLRGALPGSAMSPERVARGLSLTLAASFVLLAVVMIRSAWISDDALITYRTIDQFVSGGGLRFNLAERVQSYTHPLWLLVLTPVYWATREAFFGPLLVSLVVSGAAIGWLVARPWTEGRRGAVATAAVCLLSSKAFVDYTTSGLETPLSYLLLALGLGLHLAPGLAPLRRLEALGLVTSLSFVNRMDSVLLLLPLLVAAGLAARAARVPARRQAAALLRGSLPAVAWLAFAVLYYGTPFPNTFYAKLATGIEPGLLREQGVFYLLHSLRFDPATPIVVVCGLALGVVAIARRRQRRAVPVAVGILLHLLYVVQIGGDFMAGRLLALPFFAAVFVLVGVPLPRLALGGLFAQAVLVSLLNPLSPLRAPTAYENRDPDRVVADRGISDERGFYYARRGLLSESRESDLRAGSRCAEPEVVVRSVCGELGYEGFTGCRDTFLADRCALADPLLARMPMIDPEHWRVGHYFRRVPKGYRESLERDENLLENPRHRALYDDVRLATRAPLFAPGRWAAIARLSFAMEPVQPRR